MPAKIEHTFGFRKKIGYRQIFSKRFKPRIGQEINGGYFMHIFSSFFLPIFFSSFILVQLHSTIKTITTIIATITFPANCIVIFLYFELSNVFSTVQIEGGKRNKSGDTDKTGH